MKCPSCGASALKRAKVPTAITVAGSEFVSELPGRRCAKCHVATVEGAAGARYELLVAAELVKRGLRGGDTFRFIRKALGMRAADLARVMNVAPETVSRWETAQRESTGPSSCSWARSSTTSSPIAPPSSRAPRPSHPRTPPAA